MSHTLGIVKWRIVSSNTQVCDASNLDFAYACSYIQYYLWHILMDALKYVFIPTFQLNMKLQILLLITTIILLANIFDEASAYRQRRKCIVPRWGPRMGQCVDTRPFDMWGRGRCAQIGGNSCQWLGSRCRCAIHQVFMSPTIETP